jgi:hypothetical protein
MVLAYKARLSEWREISTDILGARPGTAIVEELSLTNNRIQEVDTTLTPRQRG